MRNGEAMKNKSDSEEKLIASGTRSLITQDVITFFVKFY